MSLIPQLNRYETCLMCGDPVPMGMPCPSCKAGEPLPAAQVVVRPSSITAPDMTRLVAPLVWDRMENGAAKADTPLARYVVSGGCWTLWTHTEGTTRYAAYEGAAIDAAQADYTARIIAALDPAALAAMLREHVVRVLNDFDSAGWYWRVMDPDDNSDNPAECIHRGYIGPFTVCEIASSFRGPTRYGFNAPTLDPESDDEDFLHFATQQEAIDAAKERRDALALIDKEPQT